MRRIGPTQKGFAAIVLTILLLAGATPVLSQSIHDRIYPAPTTPIATATLPAGAERVAVHTSDGLSITGAAIAAAPGKPTLLVFHGNGSSAMSTLDWFAPAIAKGYGVVAAEYRGYSGNPGRADEAGLARDADAFYAEARRRAGGGRLIVVGHSLSGGVALGLASRQKLDALVTIGTFTSLRAMVPKIARAFVSDRYDNLATVPTLDEPYFLIHGLADDTVPAAMGQELHKAAYAAKRTGFSLVIQGANHHPDGALLAAILEMIVAHLDHPDAAPLALPDTVKMYGFG
ncbi:alpha/beta hydrolase [Sphingomonas echinoides]|uniref:Alpha/beta hydrolase n=1 Tax=Sphingomonas echinoides TaxID=59803 RepID=A0ABU4PNV1_9SPHN|nr:alpha/beta hydrolase [Sphingomonas echinoides]MDX5984792.1 alpha/beta hydrolase [Sphingomonas echinoides]